MLNIMIVDDNYNLRRVMRICLTQAGYNVYEAENGVAALQVLDKVPIHLMIVDVMMPGMDGFELTCELRSGDVNIPVLMVTARDTLEDKRRGFDTGVDDYLVKPINMDELVMRVGALLRRSRISNERKLVVGSTVLDYSSMGVSVGGRQMTIPQKEFHLLYHLLSYPGKIFTRQDLIDAVWGYDNESTLRTVDVHIMRIRDRFKDNPDFEIVTVWGLGYKSVRKQG